mmetsp:Transcript_12609/g.19398  ORF Transcript_12609/g.19398 Transcript_12609/m.19398 type:complete len:101 (+) Transcript_12609:370-672(+)
MSTVHHLRLFLFGTKSKESKKSICSDRCFLEILFGSMRTIDSELETDMMQGFLGYTWSPSRGDKTRKLFDDGIPPSDDPTESMPESFDDYYPEGCSWLMH